MGWVYNSLGRRWGIVNGVWDILDTLIDNSIYPVIFADNCLRMGYIPIEYKNIVSWLMVLITFAINYGEIQGIAAIFLCVFIMLPFVFGILVTPWDNMYTYTRCRGTPPVVTFPPELLFFGVKRSRSDPRICTTSLLLVSVLAPPPPLRLHTTLVHV